MRKILQYVYNFAYNFICGAYGFPTTLYPEPKYSEAAVLG